LRLLLAPQAGAAILNGDFTRALLIFGLAGSLDGLDGYLARRYHWESRVGAYLDPVADKLLMAIAYVCLGLTGALPAWLIGLVFGRDIGILFLAGVGYFFLGVRQFPPSILGKISTVLQILCVLVVLLRWQPLVAPMTWAVALLTVTSAAHYLLRTLSTLRATREP